MQSTQERIAEIEAARAAALHAEQARLAREQADREQIEAANAELASLREVLRNEQWQEALRFNQQLVEANAAAIAPLIDALNAAAQHLVDIANRYAPAVEHTFQVQQGHFDQSLEQAVQGIDFAAQARQQAGPDADPRVVDNLQMQLGRLAYGQREKQAAGRHAVSLPQALLHWIGKSPDAATRQARQGIYFALTGNPIVDVRPEYSPAAEVTQNRANQYRRI